jgi:hypothetical protein
MDGLAIYATYEIERMVIGSLNFDMLKLAWYFENIFEIRQSFWETKSPLLHDTMLPFILFSITALLMDVPLSCSVRENLSGSVPLSIRGSDGCRYYLSSMLE